MTPEIAGLVVIVLLFALLLLILYLWALKRQADREEMEKLKSVSRAFEEERDAALDNVEQQADAVVISFIRKFNALSSRESEECLHCGAHVEMLEQVGRSVYARPCECKQFQGNVPEAWKK